MRRSLAGLVITLAASLVTAEAGAQPRTPVMSLRLLPAPGPVSGRSVELVNGWRLAEAALRIRLPRSTARSITASARWSRETFAPWVQRKVAAIRAAEQALQPIAARPSPEALVGAAIVGLLYEDLQSTLRHIPAPAGIASDPQLAEIFVGALEDQARPMLDRAIQAYTFCATRGDATGAFAESYRAVCTTRSTALEADAAAMEAAAAERQARRAATPAPTRIPP